MQKDQNSMQIFDASNRATKEYLETINDFLKYAKSVERHIKNVERYAKRVDLKVRNEYEQGELTDVRKKIGKKLEQAKIIYNEECKSGDYPSYELVDNICKAIRQVEYEKREDKTQKLSDYYIALYDFYREQNYSFRIAERETVTTTHHNENTGLILLCKNVHIMEDVINKICTNNIDKSIIGGEQQFESMKCGFEWLFCREDIANDPEEAKPKLKELDTNNADRNEEKDERRNLDIRDINRYLDFIKYQIMVGSKYVTDSWKTSDEIDGLYVEIKKAFEKQNYKKRKQCLDTFKQKTSTLINKFFLVYELLVTYRDLRFKEEEIRKAIPNDKKINSSDGLINNEIINLSSVAVRVLLDRFVSFVKISDLNFGNSTFKRAWFNYSELSKSNYSGSDFKYARIENARMKDCDISTCNMTRADGGNTDFSQSNFTYSNLCGINLVTAILNGCEFQNAAFTDDNISTYKEAWRELMNALNKESKTVSQLRAKSLFETWQTIDYYKRASVEPFNNLRDIIIDLPVFRFNPDKELKDRYDVLKYPPDKEDLSNLHALYKIHEDINKQYLSNYISSELIAHIAYAVKNKEESVSRDDRIMGHGKVYLDAADLEKASVKNAKLSGVNLNRVKMTQASFEDSDLSSISLYYSASKAVSFMKSNLNQTDCFESNFYQANFSSAVINNAFFISCNLDYTNWNRAVMINTVFADFSHWQEDMFLDVLRELHPHSSHPQGIKLVTNPPVQSVSKNDIILDEAEEKENKKQNNLYWQTSCHLDYATMNSTLADRSIFLNINANRSCFNKSSMKSSFWFNCRANLADFIGTDMRYSFLSHCDMGQSNFTDANMTSMDIRYVDFSDCNLSDVLFNKSTVEHAFFDNANTRNLNLSGATVRNSVFSHCQLDRAIVTNATIQNCVFINVDFTDMIGFRNSEFRNNRYIDCVFKEGKKPQIINGTIDKLQDEIYHRPNNE